MVAKFKLIEVDKDPDDRKLIVKVVIKPTIAFVAADLFVNYDPLHWICTAVHDPDPEDGWDQFTVRVDEETMEGRPGNVNMLMGAGRFGQVMQPGKYGSAKLKFRRRSGSEGAPFLFEWDRTDEQRQYSRTKLVDTHSGRWEEPDIQLLTIEDTDDV